MKTFKTLLWFYYCSGKYSLCMCVCVCVTNTAKNYKKDKMTKCPMYVNYVFLNVRFFL